MLLQLKLTVYCPSLSAVALPIDGILCNIFRYCPLFLQFQSTHKDAMNEKSADDKNSKRRVIDSAGSGTIVHGILIGMGTGKLICATHKPFRRAS